jgi:hypothetical protein
LMQSLQHSVFELFGNIDIIANIMDMSLFIFFVFFGIFSMKNFSVDFFDFLRFF